MSDDSSIKALYNDALAISKFLADGGETSLFVSAKDNFRKSLLLAVASRFEEIICSHVVEFIHEKSTGSEAVINFVRNKAISRQYHTWFKWDANNANTFFGLFGDEFKRLMQSKVQAEPQLDEGIKAFLSLGNDRNKLIHNDYAIFPMEKTIEEVFTLYEKAQFFVEKVPEFLRSEIS